MADTIEQFSVAVDNHIQDTYVHWSEDIDISFPFLCIYELHLSRTQLMFFFLAGG